MVLKKINFALLSISLNIEDLLLIMDNIAFHTFGVDLDDHLLNGALLHYSRKKIIVRKLTHENVKPFYIKENPLVVSALSSKDVLTREVTIPKRSKQDLQTTLFFQVEGFLPYPIENASLQFYPLELKKKEERYLSFATKKEKVSEHFQKMKTHDLQPEVVSCNFAALLELSQHLILQEPISLILSLRRSGTELLFLQGGNYFSSRYIDIGSADLIHPPMLKKWQKEILKILFSMQLDDLSVITLLGRSFLDEKFFQMVQQEFPKTFIRPLPKSTLEVTPNELLTFGTAIGLALLATPRVSYQINFCSNEHLPSPLKRLRKHIYSYFLLSLIFALSLGSICYYLSLQKKEHLEQKAAALLKWKQEFFEIQEERAPLLQQNDLAYLLEQLEITEPTFSYPYQLAPNTYTIYDFLIWLSKIPKPGAMHIEKLHYSIIKYPRKGALQDPYLAKVDLEFKSPSQSLLKDIQDKLMEPNPIYYTDKEFRITPIEMGCRVSLLLKNRERNS